MGKISRILVVAMGMLVAVFSSSAVAQNPLQNDEKIEECIRILNVNILIVVNGVEAITATREAVEKAIAEMEGKLTNIKGDLALADEFSSGSFSEYELTYLIAIEEKYHELQAQILQFQEQLECWKHIEKVFKLLELRKPTQPSQEIKLPEEEKVPGEEERARLFELIVDYWKRRAKEVQQMLTHVQQRKGEAQAEIDRKKPASGGTVEISDQNGTGTPLVPGPDGNRQTGSDAGEFDIGVRLREHKPYFFSIGLGTVFNETAYRVPTGGGGGVIAQDFNIEGGGYHIEARLGARWAINEKLHFEGVIGGYIGNRDSNRILNIGGPPFGGTTAPFNGTVRTRVINVGGFFVFLDPLGEGNGDIGIGGTIGWGEETLKDNNSGFQASDDITRIAAEVFYRFPISDNIDLQPGIYAIFNPNGSGSDDTVFVGVIRTTFSF